MLRFEDESFAPTIYNSWLARYSRSKKPYRIEENIMDWLMNETISNYVIFILGLIVGVVTEIIRARLQKQKPSIIQVEKERDTSLIAISPEARERLKITYSRKESKNINELRQITLGIINTGENPIQNIEFGIVLKDIESDDLLEVVIDDALWNNREVNNESRYTYDGDLSIWVIMPFLNPYKPYADTIKVQIYSSKAVNIKNVSGGGLGWSVRYFDRFAYNSRLEKTLAKASSPLEAILIRAIIKLIAR